MSAKTTATTIGLALLTTALPFARALPAQEVIDLPGQDQPLDADFEEVFRIGVMDGEPWEMFGGVRYVGFDASGNLYIVDGLGGGGISADDLEATMRAVRAMMGSDGLRVLVFDASGNFLREFGSGGEGPGEFKMPTGFAVMRDGTMVVMDIGHRAYQLFDANGEFLRMVRGSGRWNTILADPRGGGVFTGDIFTFTGGASTSRSFISGDGTPSGPPTSRPVLRLDLGDEDVHTDTVVEGWLPPVGGEDIEVPQNIRLPGNAARALRRSMSGFSLPAIFEPQLLAGVLPDGGIVHSDSSAYALKITPPDAGEEHVPAKHRRARQVVALCPQLSGVGEHQVRVGRNSGRQGKAFQHCSHSPHRRRVWVCVHSRPVGYERVQVFVRQGRRRLCESRYVAERARRVDQVDFIYIAAGDRDATRSTSRCRPRHERNKPVGRAPT